MTSLSLETLLRPLWTGPGSESVLHVALHGSVTHRPLADLGDVDVHVLLDRATTDHLDRAVVRATAAAESLGAALGCPVVVELRRGPFKPEPGATSKQLHVILDDTESVRALPLALQRHLQSAGRPLFGGGLEGFLGENPGPAACLRSAADEVDRVRRALGRDEVAFRAWATSPVRLEEAWISADTPWLRACLARSCAAVADRLPLAACREDQIALAGLVARGGWLTPWLAASWSGPGPDDQQWPHLRWRLGVALRDRGRDLRQFAAQLDTDHELVAQWRRGRGSGSHAVDQPERTPHR